jgi:hypothetical protein
MDRHPPLTEMDANSEWFGSEPPEETEPDEQSTLPRDDDEMDRVIFESLVSPLV